MKYGIHWFRRDLRVAGNSALQSQFVKNDGEVIGLFCFDKEFLARKDFSTNRFQFFLHTLKELKTELRELGSDLLVLDMKPLESFRVIFDKMKASDTPLPSLVSWNKDYEPFAIKRDHKIANFLQGSGIEYFTQRDHLLIEPHELERAPNQGYQVYSPFSRKWLEIFKTPEIQQRVTLQKKGLNYLRKREKGEVDKVFKLTWKKLFKNSMDLQDSLSQFIKINGEKVDIPIPKAGSLAAFKALQDFKNKATHYKDERDFPDKPGTSGLSIFLKNGSITNSQIICYLKLQAYKKKASGEDTFLSELIWREFYYHILFRNPYVETKAFNKKYQDLKWKNSKAWFDRWKTGTTGFPIVDAGMRQLNKTGWMHNRVRMIVASFLTKDLHIDWKWGEKYFMEKLLDGDLAPNNGGWQWAASTGCDAQPYFRIFNPWLQSKRFDPNGVYIKKYIPELGNLETKHLHEPILGHKVYPEPIVVHAEQKDYALILYKEKA